MNKKELEIKIKELTKENKILKHQINELNPKKLLEHKLELLFSYYSQWSRKNLINYLIDYYNIKVDKSEIRKGIYEEIKKTQKELEKIS